MSYTSETPLRYTAPAPPYNTIESTHPTYELLKAPLCRILLLFSGDNVSTGNIAHLHAPRKHFPMETILSPALAVMKQHCCHWKHCPFARAKKLLSIGNYFVAVVGWLRSCDVATGNIVLFIQILCTVLIGGWAIRVCRG